MPVDLSFDELMANDVAVSNFLGTLRFGHTLPAVPFHYPLPCAFFSLLAEFLSSINEQSLFSLYFNCVVSCCQFSLSFTSHALRLLPFASVCVKIFL